MLDAVRSPVSLLRLLAWLSPAFPVGSFSYSGGLERVVHDGLASDAAALHDWIQDQLEIGAAWNDAVLFCEAHRCALEGETLAAVADLAEALAGSRERHMETMAQGEAFLAAARDWPGLALPDGIETAPYAVAVGGIAGANDVAVADACAAFLHAYASNAIQAAIRLGVLGQSRAVTLIATLEATVTGVAARAIAASLDELGSAAIMADIVSLAHETQYSRLFRS
jgi:urease accessory protein